jgi:membrane-associated phospholipid phosphatase
MKKLLPILFRLDRKIFIKINSLPHWNLVDSLSPIVDIWYYPVVFYSFILGENWQFTGKILIIAIMINSIVLKRVFKRKRTSAKFNGVHTIDKPISRFISRYDTYAFPSGSAAISAAVTVALFFLHSQLKFLALIMVLINGLQRLYAGAHLPSEVLGGWISGALTAVAAIAIIGAQ